MTDAPERIWSWDDENCTPNNPQNKFTTEYIRADLCRPEPQGWQPIETAPKDGTRILMAVRGFVPAVAYWQNDRGVFDYLDAECMPDERAWQAMLANSFEWEPTHWMPLPEPPKP